MMHILVTSAGGANGNGYGAILASAPRANSRDRSVATRGSPNRAACPSTRRAHLST